MNAGQAAQLSKGLAKQYRAVLALAEAMEEIGSLETARDKALYNTKEATDALSKVKYEVEQKEANLKNIRNELRSIESSHAKASEEKSKEMSKMVKEATNEAKDIVGKAKTQAYIISSEMQISRSTHIEEMEMLDVEIQKKEEHLSKVEKSLVRIFDSMEKKGTE